MRNQHHAHIQPSYVVASVRTRLEALLATLTDELAGLKAAERLQTITSTMTTA
ncbi:MAG TPA: hypothetical protein VGD69_12290 [Herpetosiphonaceae bacterium]